MARNTTFLYRTVPALLRALRVLFQNGGRLYLFVPTVSFLVVTLGTKETAGAGPIVVTAAFEGLEAQTFSFGPPNTFPLDVTFVILNGTGIDWTDFTISIVASGLLEFSTANTTLTVGSMTFLGPNRGVLVPAGGTFTLPTDAPGGFTGLRILNPDNVANIDVRLVPSIRSIPEPSTLTLALVGIGTLSLLGCADRKRRKGQVSSFARKSEMSQGPFSDS
ncbi:MAG: PEP-CTERM sorting domain-containing protein [Paludisphaera borealis]|uniref:PEP-CTERM sorting domain-containing protein n=1 Tax=Paludisphaera borealis TaxID=1387353 RepID=UPI00284C3CE1|nr:PEP-CTERM sorting domain-containing protein [Paludisphaera borealis]MDR3621372.1 PEP-CTERM sorting domain-containing protein [Paludisphaera borealis]